MIYFRCDINEIIATGHVMRCLSIADAGKSEGIESTFIMADDGGKELVERHGHKVIILETQWDDMESEIEKILEIVTKLGIRRILVDSYQVTPKYFDSLSEETSVYYIDDLDAFHYNVEGIICYANYYEKFQYEKKYPNKKLLLGCSYIPLREEFSFVTEKVIRESIENIIILSGGGDSYHVCKQLLKKINISKYKSIKVICGRYNLDYENLKFEYSSFEQVKILQNVSNLVDIMMEADFAISAGGSTLYELCACGTPTIAYSFADNQLDNVNKFDSDAIIEYMGDFRDEKTLKYELLELDKYESKDIRKQLSKRMKEYVAINGAKKILEELVK